MASNKLILTFAFILIVSSAFSPLATNAMNCGVVYKDLGQCIPYLRSGGYPKPGCCAGVANLNRAANNKFARKMICKCLKTMYNSVNGLNLNAAKALPGICKVNVGYPIDPNVDCNRVN